MSFAARIGDEPIPGENSDDAREAATEDADTSGGENPHAFLSNREARRAEVDRRQEVIAEWLHKEGYEGVFLFEPDTFAWFTAGGEYGGVSRPARSNAFLFITARQRCLVSSSEVTARIFEEELDGLGFQSKQFAWSRPVDEMVADLRGGRTLPADQAGRGLVDRSRDMAELRSTLSEFDQSRYRTLARYIAHAVEATCRAIRPAESEWEIVGHLSHRLLHHGIDPVEIHVLDGGESPGYPWPGSRRAAIGSACSILALARCRGLYAMTSRSISFGAPGESFRQAHRIATLVCGTLLRFSLAGEEVGTVVRKGMRIYQKYGAEFAWHEAAQGGLLGYSVGRMPLAPESRQPLLDGQALAWTPFCHGVVSAETVLVGKQHPEPLIHNEDWPTVGVEIHGAVIPRPDILIRE